MKVHLKFKAGGQHKFLNDVETTSGLSSNLLFEFVRDVFIELGFHPRIVLNKHVWLYNMQEVESYKKIVRVHNPRLLK